MITLRTWAPPALDVLRGRAPLGDERRPLRLDRRTDGVEEPLALLAVGQLAATAPRRDRGLRVLGAPRLGAALDLGLLVAQPGEVRGRLQALQLRERAALLPRGRRGRAPGSASSPASRNPRTLVSWSSSAVEMSPASTSAGITRSSRNARRSLWRSSATKAITSPSSAARTSPPTTSANQRASVTAGGGPSRAERRRRAGGRR